MIYYELEEGERSSSRGIVEVCPDTHRWEGGTAGRPGLVLAAFQRWLLLMRPSRITRFLEKPQEGLTGSRLASVVFYCIQRDTLSHLSDFLSLRRQGAGRSFGHFWVCV